MVISNKAALPKYQEIRSFLMERLSSGAYQPGDRFYSENELAEKFSTTNLTVRQAMALLEQDKFIERKRGSGTFVRKLPNRPSRLKITDHCTIGILTGNIELTNNLALGRVITSLHKCASENGYMLYLSHNHIQSLIDAQVEGIVAVGFFEPDDIRLLEKCHIPVVGIGLNLPGNFPVISTDFELEGSEIVQYFHQCGLNHIAVIGAGPEATTASSMLPAMRKEVKFIPGMILREFVNPPESEYMCTKAMMKKARPDVLFLLNWMSISPVLQALDELKLKIPEDVSILVHGENALALHSKVPLSIVRSDIAVGCQKIMEVLFQIIKTGKIEKMHYYYDREILNLGSINDKNTGEC
ncbi:MAG: GntR family transcriptional regulator [Lentisphaerota bacterium]